MEAQLLEAGTQAGVAPPVGNELEGEGRGNPRLGSRRARARSYSARERAAVLVALQASKQPLARFCRERGLSPTTVYTWRRKLGGDDSQVARRSWNRTLRSEHVLELLAELFVERGVPEYIRSDNGPEFTCIAVREWLARVGVQTLFIEPGSPWENGYNESFNGSLRDELLDGEIFFTLHEARVVIEWYRQEYNHIRPHSSLNYRPPAPEAILPWGAGFAPLRLPPRAALELELAGAS